MAGSRWRADRFALEQESLQLYVDHIQLAGSRLRFALECWLLNRTQVPGFQVNVNSPLSDWISCLLFSPSVFQIAFPSVVERRRN